MNYMLSASRGRARSPSSSCTYNFGVDSYEPGTACPHIAPTIESMGDTLAATSPGQVL